MSARITARQRWASPTFAGWRCTVTADSEAAAEQAVAHLGLVADLSESGDGAFDVLVVEEAAP
jgi:hypothetical protein